MKQLITPRGLRCSVIVQRRAQYGVAKQGGSAPSDPFRFGLVRARLNRPGGTKGFCHETNDGNSWVHCGPDVGNCPSCWQKVLPSSPPPP